MSLSNLSQVNSHRIDLTLLFTSRVARSFAAGTLAVAIPLYFKNSLHLSYMLIGILFASGAFTAPVFSYFFGKWGDKYGRKKILLLAVSFLPIAISILLVTNNYLLLLLATALGGFGIAGGIVGGGVGAFVAPMQTALLAEKTNKENRTTVYTSFTMLPNLDGSFGALILVVITNYSELFSFSLIFTLISVIIIIPLKEAFKPKKIEKKTANKSGNVTSCDKEIIKKFNITGVFNGLGQGLITPFLPIIFQQYFNLNDAEIGTVIAIGGLLTTLMMIGTPYLTNKLGFVNFILITRAISCIFVLVFPFSPTALVSVVNYWIITITRAIALPSQQALMMNLVSERARSEASGSNQAARLFPLATSTTFSGDILDFMPLYVSFFLAFTVNIFNIVLYQKFFGDVEVDEKKAHINITAS